MFFYLLFRGELPNQNESHLLETLMIALINPGPRHPATRAAMNAGIGKTNPLHILPIASSVLGGKHMGGEPIDECIRFLRKQQTQPAELIAQKRLADLDNDHKTPTELFPCFGKQYGGVDLMAEEIVLRLTDLPAAGESLKWGAALAKVTRSAGFGWLMPGVAAMALSDLGFQPRAGGALFQIFGAPGLVAHGLELANKPITAMPFVGDECYDIQR